jgi:alkanesulfonate monooxygenase SsuD/methylene tetrahydromethanopterin reductase-like flavin-dependent oxidoreductase (luciferase family)
MTDTSVDCVLFANGLSTDEAIRRAQLAESLGFATVYSPQATHRDALMLSAAYAQATSRIKVGTSVLPIYWSAPAAMGMTATTVQELSGGRLRLGLGVSHAPLIEGYHSTTIGKPLADAREYVELLKAALRNDVPRVGKRWTVGGPHTDLPAPVPDVPIYLAGLRRKMLFLAGEIADGVFLVNVPPEYVRDVVIPEVRAGRERAGLGLDGFEITVIVNCTVSEDVESARNEFRGFLAWYMALPYYRAVFEEAGYGHVVAGFDAADDFGAKAAALTNEFVDALAAVGSPTQVGSLLGRFAKAGATSLAISPGVQPGGTGTTMMTAASAADFELVLKTAIDAVRDL